MNGYVDPLDDWLIGLFVDWLICRLVVVWKNVQICWQKMAFSVAFVIRPVVCRVNPAISNALNSDGDPDEIKLHMHLKYGKIVLFIC